VVQFLRFYQRRLMMKHLEIPYIELGAVLAAGAGISYLANMLSHKETHLVNAAIDVMTVAGTYLVGKAAFQLARSVREATMTQEPTESLLTGADSLRRKNA